MGCEAIQTWATVAGVTIAAFALVWTAVGVSLAAKQLGLNTKEIQRATLALVTARSEALHLRMLDDPDLQSIVTGKLTQGISEKQGWFINMLINHSAFIFDLYGPDYMPTEFENDMRDFFSDDAIYKRLQAKAKYHKPAFLNYVCILKSEGLAPRISSGG